MSRSRRHEPIIGVTTQPSEKLQKRWWNRIFRRRTRIGIARGDDALPVAINRETETWTGPKDGKVRIDPTAAPHLMRK